MICNNPNYNYSYINTHSDFLHFLSLWSKYFKTPSTISNVQYTDNYITNKHTYKSYVHIYTFKINMNIAIH